MPLRDASFPGENFFSSMEPIGREGISQPFSICDGEHQEWVLPILVVSAATDTYLSTGEGEPYF